MARARHVSFFPFTGPTNIDNLQRRFPLVQFVDAHLADSFDRKSAGVPRLHSVDQISGKFCVTRPDKQSQNFFQIVIIFENKQDRFLGIEHPTGPNRKDRRAANVERAGDVTAAKREHCSHIDQLAGFFFRGRLECFRRQPRHARQTAKHFRSARVYLFHSRIIGRHRRRGRKRIVGEFFHVIELEKFIVPAFITDGAGQTSANVRAAR